MPGPVGALADWQGWHSEREAKPSPESLRGRAVVGTEWVLKELSWSLKLMERASQASVLLNRYRKQQIRLSPAPALFLFFLII